MPRILAGHYHIDALLGRGGMGEVFRATDQVTAKQVAIKSLHEGSFSAEVVSRFEREGEALRRLNHRNIVKTLATFEEDGRRYLVMELVGGGSLRDQLDSSGPLEPARAVELSLDLCDALTQVHRLGIVHRDLKPDNVLLGEDNSARLTDFGVAHFAGDTHLTVDGAIIGTTRYLSPQACLGHPAGPGQDIWALGVMLYELLTGQVPFWGPEPKALLNAILTQPTPDLQAIRPATPKALVDLIYRMLDKNEATRIDSVRQIGADLLKLQRAPRPPGPAAHPELLGTELQLLPQESTAVPTVSKRLNNQEQFDPAIQVAGRSEESEWRAVLIDKVRNASRHVLNAGLYRRQQIPLRVQSSSDGAETSLKDYFVTLGGGTKLLLLGEVDAGKTTSLAALAGDLVEGAAKDPHLPVPVMFDLSTFVGGHLSLDGWIVEQLDAPLFKINKGFVKKWLQNGRLTLLLDGLDEIQTDQWRERFVDLLNRFPHGRTGVLVSSRSGPCDAIANKIQVWGTVELLPLSPSAIDEVIGTLVETDPEPLREQIESDEALLRLASAPGVLEEILLGYTRPGNQELSSGSSPENLRTVIVERFVDAMLAPPLRVPGAGPGVGAPPPFEPNRVKRTMAGIAQSHQNVFFIEAMQPGLWLGGSPWYWLYKLGPGGLAIAAATVSIGRPGLIPGIVLGLVLSLICSSDVRPWYFGAGSMGIGRTFIREMFTKKSAVQIYQISGALACLMMIGAFSGFGVHGLVENIGRRGLSVTGIFGGVLDTILSGAAVWLLGPIFFLWVLSSVFLVPLLPWWTGLVSPRPALSSDEEVPQQGIWGSVGSAAIMGLWGVVLFQLMTAYSQGGPVDDLKTNLFIFVVGAFLGGLSAAIQHWTLRVVLFVSGRMPWRLGRFLSQACELRFLQPACGGYKFKNDAVRSYFRALTQ